MNHPPAPCRGHRRVFHWLREDSFWYSIIEGNPHSVHVHLLQYALAFCNALLAQAKCVFNSEKQQSSLTLGNCIWASISFIHILHDSLGSIVFLNGQCLVNKHNTCTCTCTCTCNLTALKHDALWFSVWECHQPCLKTISFCTSDETSLKAAWSLFLFSSHPIPRYSNWYFVKHAYLKLSVS